MTIEVTCVTIDCADPGMSLLRDVEGSEFCLGKRGPAAAVVGPVRLLERANELPKKEWSVGARGSQS